MIIWENIENDHTGYLYRAKVPGGWLVKVVEDVISQQPSGMIHPQINYQIGYEWRTSITFMPDPDHEWNPMENENESKKDILQS